MLTKKTKRLLTLLLTVLPTLTIALSSLPFSAADGIPEKFGFDIEWFLAGLYR